MRNAVVGVLWFTLVFTVGLVWFFPVDAVVVAQLRQAEERTGLRVRWTGEHWSLWNSRVDDVTVVDRNGHQWLRLSTLSLRPRLSGIDMQGRADWGGISGIIDTNSITVDVEGYPVPTPSSKAIEDGRLRAHVVLMQANSSAHGTFNLSGHGRIFVYEGPIAFEASFEATQTQAQASVEVHGDRLRGHSELTFSAPTGDWSQAQVSGPLRVEQKGMSTSLQVSGQVGNLAIQQTQ